MKLVLIGLLGLGATAAWASIPSNPQDVLVRAELLDCGEGISVKVRLVSPSGHSEIREYSGDQGHFKAHLLDEQTQATLDLALTFSDHTILSKRVRASNGFAMPDTGWPELMSEMAVHYGACAVKLNANHPKIHEMEELVKHTDQTIRFYWR